MGNKLGIPLEGKYIVWDNKKDFAPEAVYLCTGGFGCIPVCMGNAVFVTQVSTGKESRIEGYHPMRLATLEEIVKAVEMYPEYIHEKVLKSDNIRFFEKDLLPCMGVEGLKCAAGNFAEQAMTTGDEYMKEFNLVCAKLCTDQVERILGYH